MARDVTDDIYYVSTGGKIPVKWTAPEVCTHLYYEVAVWFEQINVAIVFGRALH